MKSGTKLYLADVRIQYASHAPASPQILPIVSLPRVKSTLKKLKRLVSQQNLDFRTNCYKSRAGQRSLSLHLVFVGSWQSSFVYVDTPHFLQAWSFSRGYKDFSRFQVPLFDTSSQWFKWLPPKAFLKNPNRWVLLFKFRTLPSSFITLLIAIRINNTAFNIPLPIPMQAA